MFCWTTYQCIGHVICINTFHLKPKILFEKKDHYEAKLQVMLWAPSESVLLYVKLMWFKQRYSGKENLMY